MLLQRRGHRSAAFTLTLILAVSFPALAVQKRSKKTKEVVDGVPVLWREPADIASRNLLQGPGGEAMKPDLSRLTFIKEETQGHSKKYRVRDAQGRVWVAKIGIEAQPETAATRLVWAAGYYTDITYLAPRVEIPGKGTFENVRFEARPKDVKRLDDEWRWEQNPFVGTRELQGLKVLMALLENWDLKDSNNRILLVRDASTGRNELRYFISDMGSTFGKTGTSLSPLAWLRKIKGSRNKPEDFVEAKFIEKVEGNLVRFSFGGKNSGLMRTITVEDARWIGGWLARLSDEQISDAFRAANYDPAEVQMLTEAVRERINELVNLSDKSGSAN